MSDTQEVLRRKIHSASELESVVRTMKVLSAASIAQYERAMESLEDYYHTVELGLRVCFQDRSLLGAPQAVDGGRRTVTAVVFGSDQGLVGQFNESVADFAIEEMKKFHGEKRVWVVGERVAERLNEAGMPTAKGFATPISLEGIGRLVGAILLGWDEATDRPDEAPLWLFHMKPAGTAGSEPRLQRLLPLDEAWRRHYAQLPWPSCNRPEVGGSLPGTLAALVREYLFVSLYRACAESLAAENATRLAAMQRAEKSIHQLQDDLTSQYQHVRQNAIDEELFDLVAGFEALTK